MRLRVPAFGAVAIVALSLPPTGHATEVPNLPVSVLIDPNNPPCRLEHTGPYLARSDGGTIGPPDIFRGDAQGSCNARIANVYVRTELHFTPDPTQPGTASSTPDEDTGEQSVSVHTQVGKGSHGVGYWRQVSRGLFTYYSPYTGLLADGCKLYPGNSNIVDCRKLSEPVADGPASRID